jgi:hypothetical protein
MQRITLPLGAVPHAFLAVTPAASLVHGPIDVGVMRAALDWAAR